MSPIYRPTELRLFLKELGIFPKKGLSQNFLIDGNILRKIVKAAHTQQDDLILEVGAGPGSLTQALLETGAHVIAVEKDFILAPALERLKSFFSHLTIFCEDILNFDLENHLSSQLVKGKKAKVIANLPYHLTTPIISKFALQTQLFSSLTVMVQHEVARRMTAQVGSADYSSFTLFLQFYSQPHYDFAVSRTCFYPVPQVDSAVVTLTLKKPPLEKEEAQHFFQMTRLAFEQRRKMLRVSLKPLFNPEQIEEKLILIGQNPLARPEMLSLDDFLKMHKLLRLISIDL